MKSPKALNGEKILEAAQRALAEAEARRKVCLTETTPTEINGPKGTDPTRYGDWERGGIVSDF